MLLFLLFISSCRLNLELLQFAFILFHSSEPTQGRSLYIEFPTWILITRSAVIRRVFGRDSGHDHSYMKMLRDTVPIAASGHSVPSASMVLL